MPWKEIVGRGFTRAQFKDYVDTLQLSDWHPQFAVVHNTSAPRLSQWHSHPGAVRMRNLESYYKNPSADGKKKAWSAGPHLFIADDLIWVFTPLTTSGVHSPSWNGVAWGIEMVGEYDIEAFPASVRDNTVEALAVLYRWAGLDPQLNAQRLRFHKEDPGTTHTHCPGHNVDKQDLVQRVVTRLAELNAGGGGSQPFFDPPAPDEHNLRSAAFKGNAALDAVYDGHMVLQATGQRVAGIELVQDALNRLAQAHNQGDWAILLGQFRGYFGGRTQTALRAFQRDHQLSQTSVVDDATIGSLDAEMLALESGQPSPAPVAPPVPGSPAPPASNVFEKIAGFESRVYSSSGAKKVAVDGYEIPGRTGYFYISNMAIDVDGSPRAYSKYPDVPTLDNMSSADGQGGSSTYIIGEPGATGRVGVGPKDCKRYYVSATSLRLNQTEMWRTDNFVNAETIPYIVFPPQFRSARPGDMAYVIDLRTMQGTHAIFADTNDSRRVGEASLRVARNLGLNDLSARNGEDRHHFLYIVFPGTPFDPEPIPAKYADPSKFDYKDVEDVGHWPDATIKPRAEACFEAWGGMAQAALVKARYYKDGA